MVSILIDLIRRSRVKITSRYALLFISRVRIKSRHSVVILLFISRARITSHHRVVIYITLDTMVESGFYVS